MFNIFICLVKGEQLRCHNNIWLSNHIEWSSFVFTYTYMYLNLKFGGQQWSHYNINLCLDVNEIFVLKMISDKFIFKNSPNTKCYMFCIYFDYMIIWFKDITYIVIQC